MDWFVNQELCLSSTGADFQIFGPFEKQAPGLTSFPRKDHRKILKISPSKYKSPPPTHKAKNPPLNRHSEYKPPGFVLKITLKYKVKQKQ